MTSESRKAYQREYHRQRALDPACREKIREEHRRRNRDWYKRHSSDPQFMEHYRQYQREWKRRSYKYEAIRTARLKNDRERRRAIREEVIAAYGGACACCGEWHLQFLTIDHIHGGGKQHRKQVGSQGVYVDLKRQGFPKDNYRVLCMNCNWSIRHGGRCIHRIDREELEADLRRRGLMPPEIHDSQIVGPQSGDPTSLCEVNGRTRLAETRQMA